MTRPTRPRSGAESDPERQQQRIELHQRHARETIAILKRLRGPNTTAEDQVLLHETHARHERELGRPHNADQAEIRARNARARQAR